MRFPSWGGVGVPKTLVSGLRQMRAGYELDSVVNQVVFRAPRRAVATYTCAVCAYIYRPERVYEQISHCPSCRSPMISLSHGWPVSKDRVHNYTRFPATPNILEALFSMMEGNYERLAEGCPEHFFSWGYERGQFWGEFSGGEAAAGEGPREAAFKAAILTPFLWDVKFWPESDGLICHILQSLGKKE